MASNDDDKNQREAPASWDALITKIYTLFSSYEMQSKKPEALLKPGFFNYRLKFIRDNYSIDTTYFEDLSVPNRDTFAQELNDLIRFALIRKPVITCDNLRGIIRIEGSFIKLTDLSSHLCRKSTTKIEIIATDTVFIDTDFTSTASDFSLAIFSPKWVVVGERTIRLLGTNAEPIPTKTSGGPGGSFFGIGANFVNAGNLKIVTKGGRGPDGGDANVGRNGSVGGRGGSPGKVKIFDFSTHSGITIETLVGEGETIGNVNPVINGEDYRNVIRDFNTLLREDLKRTKIIKETIRRFLVKLNTNPEIIDYLQYDGILKEYEQLQKQFQQFSSGHIDLFPFYNYLIDAVDRIGPNIEDKIAKISLSHLYTSLLTKMNIIQDDSLDGNVVVKIGDYLGGVTDGFKFLKKHGNKKILHDYEFVKNEGIIDSIQQPQEFIEKYDNSTTGKTLKLLGEIGEKLAKIVENTNQVPSFLYSEEIPRMDLPREEISSVKSLTASLRNVESGEGIVKLTKQIDKDLDGLDKRVSIPDITRWKIPNFLKRIKFDLKQQKNEGTLNTLEAVNSMIHAFELLENYYRQKKMSDFLNKDWPQIQNTSFGDEIVLNLILGKYEHGINSIRQFAFPYVHTYFDGYKLQATLLQEKDPDELLKESIARVESLNRTIFHSIQPIDQYIMNYNGFSRRPSQFAIWDNAKHKALFSRLFAGEEILLRAAPRKFEAESGAKVSWFELNFKALNQSNKKMIDDELKHHQISLHHSGNSYYQWNKKIYLITTNSANMSYSLEKDGNGESLSRNLVYANLHNGDSVLSPFTTWRIRILKTDRHPFTAFENFHDMVELQLVAHKYKYISARDTFCVNDNDITKFYELDEPFEAPILEKNRQKRNADFVARSSAALFSSPLNDMCNWMASSIRQIRYLTNLAPKPIEGSSLPNLEQVNPNTFFDQVNSWLILGPVLVCLGKTYFQHQRISGDENERRIESARVETCKIIVKTFGTIVKKYNLKIGWLLANLEDRSEDIEAVKTNGRIEDVEICLVTLLLDFLEDVEYEPLLSKVKYDKDFLGDVNELIETAAKIHGFANKLNVINCLSSESD